MRLSPRQTPHQTPRPTARSRCCAHPRSSAALQPKPLARALAAGALLTLLLQPGLAQTLPTGAQVVAGQAQISVNAGGTRMTVVNTPQTILNWNSFSVGAGHAVYFQQTGASSAVLNRVTGNEASSIFGSLASNGRVWLLNPNGVLFGAGSRVDVAGLVASTLRLSDGDWLAGRYSFAAGNAGAAVVNRGELVSSFGGTIALLGDSVANSGLVQAPGGQIVLAAGSSVELVDTGAPNLSVKLTAPAGEARNLGTLQAAGGRIDIHAAAVNSAGVVSADGFASGPGGEVWIKATGAIELAAASRTSADGSAGGSVHVESEAARSTLQGVVSAQGSSGSGGAVVALGREVGLLGSASIDVSGALGGGSVVVGGGLRGQDLRYANAQAVYFGPQASISADATQQGAGGQVVLWSDKSTRALGALSVRGGAAGGDGGFIETSGGWLDARPARLDTSAAKGRSGNWLLDPYNITITSNGTTAGGTLPDFNAGSGNATVSAVDIRNALSSGTNVTITTGGSAAGAEAGNISVAGVSLTVGPDLPGKLTLIADGNLTISSSSIGSFGGPMDITLLAGRGGSGAVLINNSDIFASLDPSNGPAARNTALATVNGPATHAPTANGPTANGPVADPLIGGGKIVIGGYASGTLPDGGSFSDAATRVSIFGSNLSAFAGTLSIQAAGATIGSAVTVSSSALQAGSIGITGAGTEGGVRIDGGSDLQASAAITLRGNASSGSGVSMADSTRAWLTPSVTDASALLLVQGRSGQAGVGVELSPGETSSPMLRASNGASITVQGSSSAPGGVGVVVGGAGAGLDVIQADTGGTLTVQAQGSSSLTFVGDVRVTGGDGGTVLDAGGPLGIDVGAYFGSVGPLTVTTPALVLGNNATLTAQGAVNVRSSVISLGIGSQFASAATGSAIVLAGTADGPISFLGIGADFSGLNTPNGRSIVYVDTPNSPALTLGNLDYDFKRYGASFGAWEGDSGSGLVYAAQQTANFTASIATRSYDGSRTATITSASVTSPNGDLGSLIPGAQALYDTPNAGTQKPASLGTSSAAFVFFDEARRPVYGYTLAGSLSGTVTPRVLSGAPTVATRVYDGTSNAPVSVGLLGNLVEGESVSVLATGSYANKNAGSGKAVTASYTLVNGNGGLASNYSFSPDSGPLTGTVTARPIAVGSLVISNKVYDGSTAASVAGSPGVTPLAGDNLFIAGQPVARFADKNVGADKPVTVSGLALGGSDAANYALQPLGSTTASITPATLLYVATPTATRVLPAPGTLTGTVTGFVGEESLASATQGTAVFTANVAPGSPSGVYAVTGSGLSAQNYVFSQAPGNAQALTLADQTVPEADGIRSRYGFAVNAEVAGATRALADAGFSDLTEAAASGAVQPVSDFGAVDVAGLSAGQLADLLAGRRLFMQNLLADAVRRLEANAGLADLRECETLEEARLGTCIVNTRLKARLAAQGVTVADMPLPQAASPAPAAQPTPAVPAAPASAAAPAATPPTAAAPAAAAPLPATPVAAPAAVQTLRLAVTKRPVRSAALPQIERKIALVIGVNDYADPSIPRLANAVNDARAVADVFEKRLGYEAVVVDNATRASLVAALNQLALTLGPRDSVVVYYAGHGELVATTQLGYWLLADSNAQQPETWLSNTDISRLIGQMGASQVALVSDSCYSGSLASEERIRALAGTLDPKAVLDRKSVVVMSSGGNEPVADDGKDGHSPFAWNLMNTLGQVNSWQAGGHVFERVRFAVARSLPQRPQYSASRAAGHQPGGDYLFEQRQLEARR